MWLSSVYLKSLRDYRIGILGWGVGMGLVLVATMAGVSQLTATPETRAELVALASSFAWNADAIAVDTIGGYATFKIGIFIFLICVWPLLAGSRTLRGEEERGSMDVLLSLPRTRARVAAEKIVAIWTALLAMGVVIGLVAYAGGRAFNGDFGLADAMLLGLDLALLCAVIAGIALVLSQFVLEGAAGWSGGLLLIFIVFDMVHRLYPGTEWLSALSPVYYYNLSKPLIPSYGTNAGAMLVLLALALLLSGLCVWLFARRDIGATVPLPIRLPARAPRPAVLPVNDWSVRSLYLRSLALIATPTFWWALAISAGASWFVIVVKQMEAQLTELLSSSPFITQILQNAGGGQFGTGAAFLSAMFQIMPILLMAFVVTQVNGWASDEENGRLELVLATPQSRTRVILARFAALSTATIVIAVVTLAVTALSANLGGVTLDNANLAAATLGMIPLGLLIGGIGYLGAGWLRTAADTGLLSFLLLFWFFIGFVGVDLGWPDTMLRVSPFYYYGTPLLKGLAAANAIGLLAVGLVALALGTLRFARKDIGV